MATDVAQLNHINNKCYNLIIIKWEKIKFNWKIQFNYLEKNMIENNKIIWLYKKKHIMLTIIKMLRE